MKKVPSYIKERGISEGAKTFTKNEKNQWTQDLIENKLSLDLEIEPSKNPRKKFPLNSDKAQILDQNIAVVLQNNVVVKCSNNKVWHKRKNQNWYGMEDI